MDFFRQYCQVFIERSCEFIRHLFYNVIQDYIDQIAELLSWFRPTQKQLVLLDLNTDEHIDEVEQPKLQLLALPPAEVQQDELKDDRTAMEKALAILEVHRVEKKKALAILEARRRKKRDEELLVALQLNTMALPATPQLLNTKLPAIMPYEEPLPVPVIQQDANQPETKPLSPPEPQVLPEKKNKPLPGQTTERVVQPNKKRGKGTKRCEKSTSNETKVVLNFVSH